PMLMNAFNNVNLAAACIVTSAGFARDLGVAEEKWVYPLGGAGTRDSYDFWHRPTFWWSPAISRSLDAGLQVSGLTKEDVDLYDLYSCFPIVPKLACQHLNLPFTTSAADDPSRKPLTLLGGLTSFGGAGNNYSLHAITEMTRQLRSSNTSSTSSTSNSSSPGKERGKRTTGLILANGGWVTYQHVVCLSNSPRRVLTTTYTVEFTRTNQPLRGHIVGRLKATGDRFIANHADERTLMELGSWEREPIGRSGYVTRSRDGEGRNVFSFFGGGGGGGMRGKL
ncbi:hypothetical protein KC321_g17630, partial [Hortaea werneckii]